MVPYLIVLSFILILAYILKPNFNPRMRLLYVWIAFGTLAIMAMIRDETVGADTVQYTGAYEQIGSNPQASLDQFRYEHGFSLLCRWLYRICPNSQFLIIVSSLFILFAVGHTVYRLSLDVTLSSFLFITLNQFFSYMNVMRQAIAIGFVLLGYCRLQKHKWVSAIVLFLIATQFHQSAWLVLLVSLLLFCPFTKFWFVFYLVTTVIMFFGSNMVTSMIAILLGRKQFYDPSHSESNYFGALIQLIFVACIVLMCFYYMPIQSKNNLDRSYVSKTVGIYQHALMLWLMFMAMGVRVEVMSRLSYYFGALAIIIIPYALNKAHDRARLYVKYAFCGVCLAYFLIIGLTRPEWYGVIPYTTNLVAVGNSIKAITGW